ncbi:MAG: zinc-ribbon domain-containing protein [Patescibacteria group bacterium]
MFSPFEYQAECCGKISEARAAGANKALVVMASGLGKTVTSAFDVQKWFADQGRGRLLYLCHQNEILHQASATFQSVLGPDYRFGLFNGHEKRIHQADCVFASLRTVLKHGRDVFRPNEFDYVVVDESHHTPAPTYLSAVQFFTPKFLLGLTATPDRRDGLSIRSVYGNEVYYLPLEEALSRGLLTPVDYRLVTDDISVGDVKTRDGLTVDDLDEQVFVPKQDREVASVILRHAKELTEPRTIVFANSIAHADRISKLLPESVTIHSKVSAKERMVRLELFRLGLVQTVVTVDCFNEGVDIPQANLIVFLRSTASLTIFFQQLGRGLRRYEGKEKVRVLDFVGNCKRIMMLKELSDVTQRRERTRLSKPLGPRSVKDIAGVEKTNFGGLGISFDEKTLEVLDIVKRVRPNRISDNELLFNEYSPRNALAASHLSAKTWREVWWVCDVCKHEYKMSAALRLSGKSCPACADRVTEDNSLLVLQPALAREYSIKNPLASWQIKATSPEVFWWQCRTCQFEWRGRARSRVHRGDGCPACAGQMPQYQNNLALKFPEIAAEYSDVNMLSPEHVGCHSRPLRWWICGSCGKSWQTSADMRTRYGLRCANCVPKIVSVGQGQKPSAPQTNIIIEHPHLAEEYASRNRIPVEEALVRSPDPLWWLCFDCGRYWQASVRQRLEGARCVLCHPTTSVEVEVIV